MPLLEVEPDVDGDAMLNHAVVPNMGYKYLHDLLAQLINMVKENCVPPLGHTLPPKALFLAVRVIKEFILWSLRVGRKERTNKELPNKKQVGRMASRFNKIGWA